VFSLDFPWLGKCCTLSSLSCIFTLDFPWLGKCCTLSSLSCIFTLDFPWLDLSGVFSLNSKVALTWPYTLIGVRLRLTLDLGFGLQS
jgi:hypothetical protein